MFLSFTCECGNQVDFHAMGDRDEHGRFWLDVEDDDRVQVISGEGGTVLRCAFCQAVYRFMATNGAY